MKTGVINGIMIFRIEKKQFEFVAELIFNFYLEVIDGKYPVGYEPTIFFTED